MNQIKKILADLRKGLLGFRWPDPRKTEQIVFGSLSINMENFH